MRTFKIVGLTFILVVTFLGCKKIAIPDPSVKAVFGKWQYVSSTGGYTGRETDTYFNKSIWIEYKENGHYEVRNSWRVIHCEKYKFEFTTSIRSPQNETYIIKYDKRIAQSFRVSNDTLFLYDEAFDCFSYVFIKK